MALMVNGASAFFWLDAHLLRTHTGENGTLALTKLSAGLRVSKQEWNSSVKKKVNLYSTKKKKFQQRNKSSTKKKKFNKIYIHLTNGYFFLT